MRVMIVGLGIQGRKRRKVAGADAVATVDPVIAGADFQQRRGRSARRLRRRPRLHARRAKPQILEYLLSNGKHVLVEKPLLADENHPWTNSRNSPSATGAVCYTAYNHRFEPHILRLKQVLDRRELGTVYSARFFYGNGTARDVRDSVWRDQGLGVLGRPRLAPARLDAVSLRAARDSAVQVRASHRFENRAFDHFCFGFDGQPALDFEMTLLSWRNTFRADVVGEKGSAHIECLCKWGPSIFTLRRRVLPSGRPDEESHTLVCADPTWQREYEHFKTLCSQPQTNIDTDIWINSVLHDLAVKVGLER